MDKEEFLKLSDREKLRVMKKARDYISHDFQHQEIVEIECIDKKGQSLRITVWEKGVDGETWPKFTDYYHHKEQYDLIHGEFIPVEKD